MALDKEDIKQLILILQKGLQDDNEQAETDEDVPNKIKTKKVSTKRNKKSPTTNNFIKLGFDKLHKEDIEIDKLLQHNKPTQRRGSTAIIKVKCRVCGKTDTISPSLLFESPDRYKCNKCCTSPG